MNAIKAGHDREHWRKVSDIFDAALDVPGEQRDSWVATACGEDDALIRELRELLKAHERRGLLDRPLTISGSGEIASEPHVDELVGPYRIVGELGRGGMGVVYKAYDDRLNRFVGLKFLTGDTAVRPDAHGRLLLEARAASALDHPNICPVYDIGQTPDGQVYIAMAFCDGLTLAERLQAGRISIAEGIEIALQVARGLACAHQAGIVHRDIKPSNLILNREGQVRILDFGVAKVEGADSLRGQVGTVYYAAPEQIRGEASDARADIWSLGVILFEMLSGRRPFAGATFFETAAAVLNEEPPQLGALVPDLSPHIASAVDKALSKEPAERFQNVQAFANALTADQVKPPAGNLPLTLTSFVGRAADLARSANLLRSVRLLTFTGPAGTGKTRLSLELAREVAPEFSGGAYFVSLSAVTDAELVPVTISEVLGIAPRGSSAVLDTLIQELGNRDVLLVLDNFEQVSAAATSVGRLLQSCSRLKLIVTSRVALRLSGEHEFAVAPLSVPSELIVSDTARMAEIPAVRLFLDRAIAAKPDFVLNSENAAAIGEVCARLDGLPLAIEFAAARVKTLPPRAIVSRLGARLDLLKSSSRDRPARHQTLRQALAWSYDLLDQEERRMFRRAGVFSGGFTLPAMEALCESFADISADPLDVIDALVDHSLLSQHETADGEPRFYLLETVREYALVLLAECGEEERARFSHAEWIGRLSADSAPALSGGEQSDSFARLDADHDNIRAALNWLEQRGEFTQAIQIAASIWRYWIARGHYREGRSRLERLLGKVGDRCGAELRAHALTGCGTLAHGSCDMQPARRFLEEALELYRNCSHQQGVAQVLNNLAWIDIELSHFEEARELAEEAYRLHQQIGDKRGLAVALNNLGWIANYTADFDEAVRCHEQSVALRRDAGDRRGSAFALSNLGWTLQRRGNYARSLELFAEATRILEDMNDTVLKTWATQLRAAVEYETGDPRVTIAAIEGCLPVWRRIGNSSGLAFASFYYSLASVQIGEYESAAAVLDAGDASVRAVPQRWGIAVLTLARSRLMAASGDREAALKLCREAIERLEEVGDRRTLADAYEWITELLSDAGMPAIEFFQKACELRAAVRVPVPPCYAVAVGRLRTLFDPGL